MCGLILGLAGNIGGVDISATASCVHWSGERLARSLAIAGTAFSVYKDGINLLQLAVSKDLEAVSGITLTPSAGLSIPLVGKSADGQRYIYGLPVKIEFIAGVNLQY